MTKAEEAVLKAYPNVEQPVWDESYPRLLFTRHIERDAFIKGYEQAEKDTIERAVSWIKKNTCMGVYEQELMRKELEDEK